MEDDNNIAIDCPECKVIAFKDGFSISYLLHVGQISSDGVWRYHFPQCGSIANRVVSLSRKVFELERRLKLAWAMCRALCGILLLVSGISYSQTQYIKRLESDLEVGARIAGLIDAVNQNSDAFLTENEYIHRDFDALLDSITGSREYISYIRKGNRR